MKKQTIKKALDGSLSYAEYVTLVNNYTRLSKTSGAEQSANHVEYTRLNASRMRRLDKTLSFTPLELSSFSGMEAQRWLVIVETWCADGAQILPVLNKIAEMVGCIDFRVVFRDENPALMDLFLTNGTRSIPKLIMLNTDLDVLATWGSRPTKATQMVTDYKLANGAVDAAFKAELQQWYNRDQGRAVLEDLRIIAEQLTGEIERR